MIKIEKLDKYFNKGKSNENHVLKEVSLDWGTGGSCVFWERADQERPLC